MPPHGRPGRADRRSARTRRGTCPSPRSASSSATTVAIVGYTIGNDVSSRDIEGAQPALPAAGEGVRRRVRDRPGGLRARRTGTRRFEITLPIRDADGAVLFAGETSTATMRRSFDELVAWLVRDNPVPPGSVLLTGHGARAARRLHARARATWSRSTIPGIGTLTNPVVRAADLLERSCTDDSRRCPPRPRANFVGGAWQRARRGETYEKRNPWRPSEVTGVFAASTADDAQAAVEAARARLPGLGARCRRRAAGGVLLQGRRRDRGAGRADRAGHDGRDGQAAARGAHGGGARRARSSATRRARRTGRRARSTSRRSTDQTPLHAAPAARRRRPDHAVELPDRDPGLEARPGARLRQHRRAQARLRGAADGPAHRRVLRGGRAAGRACSTSLTGAGSKVGRRARRATRTCARSPSPARSPSASAVRDEATARQCRVQLELGGHNPLIVMADAELDRAVEAAYAGAFWSAGQKCTATRRILVEDAVYDDVPRASCSQRIDARQGRRPGRSRRRRSGPIVEREAVRGHPRGDRARQGRGRHRRSPAASAPTTRRYLSRRPSSRASPTTRSSPARRSSARSRRSIASRRSTRRCSARTRSSSGSPRRSSPRDLGTRRSGS